MFQQVRIPALGTGAKLLSIPSRRISTVGLYQFEIDAMQIGLDTLMKVILSDPDAAVEAGWTPRHWEAVGFAALARRRIQEVGDLRVVLASLGATELLKDLRDYNNDERVELVDNPFVSY